MMGPWESDREPLASTTKRGFSWSIGRAFALQSDDGIHVYQVYALQVLSLGESEISCFPTVSDY